MPATHEFSVLWPVWQFIKTSYYKKIKKSRYSGKYTWEAEAGWSLEFKNLASL